MATTDTENIINIINAVKVHECLWNVHSPEYAKRDKLEKAWAQVALDVGRSDMYCREKWRNVRTGFLRSVQNNIRIVTDDSSNDLMAVRKKRFYLYDYMKFLLPSAETLGEARKRRKLSKVTGKIEDFNESTNDTLQAYTLIGKYEQSSETDAVVDDCNNEQEEDEEELTREIDTNYVQQLSNEIRKNTFDKNSHKDSSNIGKRENEFVPQTEAAEPTHSIFSTLQDNTVPVRCIKGYESRDVEQLIDFFRGNIDDILSLSKRNQRTFKRKMLELIEELHDLEDSVR